MAKAKDTPDYEAIGKAVVLLASLFNSGAAVAAPSPSTTSTSGSSDAGSNAPAASTPEAPKADGPPEGNSQGLSKDDFSKFGMAFAKDCGDQGAKLKAIWANFKQADGSDVKKLSDVQEKDYDAFVAAIEEARLA